jgi:peptidoglycan/LPS O-acetylase OafA/YrhL
VVATSRAPSRTTFPYLAPLDGLRGALVIPVVLYHFSITGGTGTILAPGAYMAPSTFFALSGFLITSLLLVERERTGGIDGRGFWTRRFRRLVPASVTVVFLCVVISAIWPSVWALSTGDVVASLFSFQNWHQIWLASHNPGDLHLLSPLSPYWSLAVEEQFYLGLFVVIALSARARGFIRVLTVSLCGVWVFSAASVILLHGSPQRELFGTDTRASELVVGCLMAVVIHRYGWPKDRRWVWAGWLALIGTCYGWAFFSETALWVRNWGLITFSILNVGLIGGAVVGGSFGALLRWRPFVELGKLSYAVYLVHWPVALLMSVQRMGGMTGWPLYIVRFAVSIAVALAIERWIEKPIRQRRVLPGWRAFAVWAGTAGFAMILAFATLGT